MDLTVDKRERLVELLASEYTVPEEYIDCVIAAVKQYATKNYSDEVIEKMVRTPQSLSKGLALLRERNGNNDLSLFRGIISEWLVCAEYNALKNKGAVIMTITNPDPSSKADLLHIINTGEGFKVVPGPDVKSGGSTYVFNQWKKIVNERYEIPMVDIDGILTTEEGLKQLTKKQRAEFDELCNQFPNKQPLDTSFDKSDINRVMADYLKFVEFDLLPSAESELSVKDINTTRIKEKLYSGTISNGKTNDWLVYINESKEILQPKTVYSEPIVEDVKVDKVPVQPKQNTNKNLQQKVKKSRGLLRFIPQHPLDGAGKILKKGRRAVRKFVVEKPEVVKLIVAGAAGVVTYLAIRNDIGDFIDSEQNDYYSSGSDSYYEDDYYSDETSIDSSEISTSESNSTHDSLESSTSESNSKHNYPEQRKGPVAHPIRRNGVVVGARGGTAEERAAIRKEHGLE